MTPQQNALKLLRSGYNTITIIMTQRVSQKDSATITTRMNLFSIQKTNKPIQNRSLALCPTTILSKMMKQQHPHTKITGNLYTPPQTTTKKRETSFQTLENKITHTLNSLESATHQNQLMKSEIPHQNPKNKLHNDEKDEIERYFVLQTIPMKPKRLSPQRQKPRGNRKKSTKKTKEKKKSTTQQKYRHRRKIENKNQQKNQNTAHRREKNTHNPLHSPIRPQKKPLDKQTSDTKKTPANSTTKTETKQNSMTSLLKLSQIMENHVTPPLKSHVLSVSPSSSNFTGFLAEFGGNPSWKKRKGQRLVRHVEKMRRVTKFSKRELYTKCRTHPKGDENVVDIVSTSIIKSYFNLSAQTTKTGVWADKMTQCVIANTTPSSHLPKDTTRKNPGVQKMGKYLSSTTQTQHHPIAIQNYKRRELLEDEEALLFHDPKTFPLHIHIGIVSHDTICSTRQLQAASQRTHVTIITSKLTGKPLTQNMSEISSNNQGNQGVIAYYIKYCTTTHTNNSLATNRSNSSVAKKTYLRLKQTRMVGRIK